MTAIHIIKQKTRERPWQIGFWLTTLHPTSGVFLRCCAPYKQSKFPTLNYLGLFTSVFKHTLVGSDFPVHILVFTSFIHFLLAIILPS